LVDLALNLLGNIEQTDPKVERVDQEQHLIRSNWGVGGAVRVGFGMAAGSRTPKLVVESRIEEGYIKMRRTSYPKRMANEKNPPG
jgi:hypothetical protein